jgi:hypothetical protein
MLVTKHTISNTAQALHKALFGKISRIQETGFWINLGLVLLLVESRPRNLGIT